MPSKHRFVVGGNGRRSGLAATKVGSVELRVLVLPKLWGDSIHQKVAGDAGGPRASIQQKVPIRFGRSLTIIAREGQAFDIEIEEPKDGPSKSLEQCFGDLVETGERVAKARADTEAKRHDEEEDEDEAITRRIPLISEGRGVKDSTRIPVITLCPLKGPAKDVPPDVYVDIVPSDDSAAVFQSTKNTFGEYWKAFQSLWLHAFEVRDLPTATFEQLGQMSASDVASLDLRLLVHIAFVNKVSELLRHARPGYVRVTKPSPFVRGHMHPVSAAIVLAGGATTVECTYDEFGLDTPLHRVIVTALEDVCDSHQAERWLSAAEGPIGEAAWLRRQFEPVQTLTRTAALRIGVGLQARMSKLDGDWANALDLACLVLDDRSLSPTPGSRSTALSWGRRDDKAFVFDISTESLWENLVRKYFRREERPKGKYSWKGLGKTKAPDGKVVGKQVIFDAKYKILADNKTPATGDTHQSFVYSHLFVSTWALLVYPVSESANETSCPPAGKKRHDDGCTLALIRLAFPKTAQVLSPATWRDFLEERRTKVANLVDAMK